MPINSFSIGRDCQLVIIGPQGRVDISFVTGFEAQQITHSVRLTRLDGVPMGTELPAGWEGSFDIERGSSAVDDFISSAEALFQETGTLPVGTIYQYVSETDGSTSTYQFSGVSFTLKNAGTWRGDQSVRQRIEFFASTRGRI